MLDENCLSLIHIVDNGHFTCDMKWVYRISRECEKILSSNHPLARNYSPRRLQLEKHLSFDLLAHNDEIVCWAGLFNGGRYPDGVLRALNRFYINPKFKLADCSMYRRGRSILLAEQMERFSDQIKFLFLSGEGVQMKCHLSRWVKYHAPDPCWQVSTKLVQVVTFENQSCYQYIAFKKYAEANWHPKEITEEEWGRLPLDG